jgi:ribose-phosphate pyrophosphokinase
MTLTLLAGSANPALAAKVAARVGQPLSGRDLETFPDGELHVAVHDSVRGHDVYLLQPTSYPVERHLFELLLLADACRRAGAARVTAVVPYFAYARQDRRGTGREAVAARVVTDLFGSGTFTRVVAIDLHTPSLEGFFTTPLEHLTALPVLVDAIRADRPSNGVVVAPDAGAGKLAEHYARLLHLPMAIVQKVRRSGAEVEARGVTGDVRQRAPLIVDDMISTGGTIAAAATALLGAGSERDVTVVATHGLFVGEAARRLAALGLRRLIVTDSVNVPELPGLPLHITSVDRLLAEAIVRLHHDRSLADLLKHV